MIDDTLPPLPDLSPEWTPYWRSVVYKLMLTYGAACADAAIERCAQVCEAERIKRPLDARGDAYNKALEDLPVAALLRERYQHMRTDERAMRDATEPVLDRLRSLPTDHEPDGWPAVRMRDITALVAEIDRLRAALREAATLDAVRQFANGEPS